MVLSYCLYIILGLYCEVVCSDYVLECMVEIEVINFSLNILKFMFGFY